MRQSWETMTSVSDLRDPCAHTLCVCVWGGGGVFLTSLRLSSDCWSAEFFLLKIKLTALAYFVPCNWEFCAWKQWSWLFYTSLTRVGACLVWLASVAEFNKWWKKTCYLWTLHKKKKKNHACTYMWFTPKLIVSLWHSAKLIVEVFKVGRDTKLSEKQC